LLLLKNETSVWFEITNLMMPGLNDDPEETRKLSGWIQENLGSDVCHGYGSRRPHPEFKLQDKPSTPPETLHARRIALEAGLHFVYEGNIVTDAGSTYCPRCTTRLVRRSCARVEENVAKWRVPTLCAGHSRCVGKVAQLIQ
jgi:pyruvate formate lyase activating enzyme